MGASIVDLIMDSIMDSTAAGGLTADLTGGSAGTFTDADNWQILPLVLS